MNFTQIEYYLMLCKTMNFTEAAKELFISQPALSRQIAVMEKELGYPLIDRSYRSLTLTPAGEYLRNAFEKLQSDYLSSINMGQRIHAENKAQITIGFTSGWDLASFLPDIKKLLINDNSAVHLTAQSYDVNDLLKALAENMIDVAVTFTEIFTDIPALNVQEIGSVSRRLFYSRQHANVKSGNERFDAFRDETFFVLPAQKFAGGERILNECCHPFGFIPQTKIMPNTESIITSLDAGLGVVLFNSIHKLSLNPRFKSIDLPARESISAAWKKDNVNRAIKPYIDRFTLIEI